jgi:hypothetical protein
MSAQIPNAMKIRPVEADMFHADGLTDTANLSLFSQLFKSA